MKLIKGIHHVSSLTADARSNYAFYTDVLGMRLVKKTVNQDDPGMYHLFYADRYGSPGTDFTFFEIPMAGRTYRGSQSISSTGLRVKSDEAIYFWKERLEKQQVSVGEPVIRAGRLTLALEDHEGQRIRLFSDRHGAATPAGTAWEHPDIPEDVAIVGLGPSELTVRSLAKTENVLINVLSFIKTGGEQTEEGPMTVYSTASGGNGAEVHVIQSSESKERPGRGSVHHLALRVEDEEELKEWKQAIDDAGYDNSGIVERYYFTSLYFRDSNGILFELATDGPGFDMDEPIEQLGQKLALPPFLEERREEIEQKLKPIKAD
ncbi:ring-cleaving dioxygenase [Alkalicoccus luteus]|uniref:Ring-cleaving dioxygenase n=1 Tax=Alkalicoccus luteus TaxID=1237094 RepID=A0A969PN67_9BACI|nr:ring-cleaving dioxygenase [Alkalicoccus luteus]NJP37302.1 ring-cleaving dioxygenase [Alkalicoccus luteus]